MFSDTHCGHRLGLCLPGTVLTDYDEKGRRYDWEVRLTATQKYLAEKYERDLQAVAELATACDDTVVLHDGDLCQGLKHFQSLMSNNLEHQVIIARDVMRPWLVRPELKVSKLRFVQGTAAHTLEGAIEPLVAHMLQAQFPGGDIEVVFHGLFTVDGVAIDCVHRGPYPGSREWLRGNVARLSLRSMMLRELLDKRRPPDLVIRAHYHRCVEEEEYVDSAGVRYRSKLVLLPSYCGMDLHGHHATQGLSWQSHGLVVFIVEGGKVVDTKPLVESLDLRTEEEL